MAVGVDDENLVKVIHEIYLRGYFAADPSLRMNDSSWSLSEPKNNVHGLPRLTTLYFESFTCFTKRSSKNCDGLAFFASGIVSDKKSRIPCTPGSDIIKSRLNPARR
jgi:hypothetical protein